MSVLSILLKRLLKEEGFFLLSFEKHRRAPSRSDTAHPFQDDVCRYEYEPPFDASAFWRYPDWTGPIDEPFWMRPLKKPERHVVDRVNFGGTPMPLSFGQARVSAYMVMGNDLVGVEYKSEKGISRVDWMSRDEAEAVEEGVNLPTP